MGLNLEYQSGQTSLDENEIDGLLIPSLATRGELDEFEQQNIEKAMQWILMRSFKQEQILTQAFVMEVHKRMYRDVWAWAGTFRKTAKNIGTDSWKIGSELSYLLQDTNYWIIQNTYPPDEIALRFKHRLVSIHCFPNGNGRHSRLMADIIIEKICKRPVFTWGTANAIPQRDIRVEYIQSVKAADAGNIIPLLSFARS